MVGATAIKSRLTSRYEKPSPRNAPSARCSTSWSKRTPARDDVGQDDAGETNPPMTVDGDRCDSRRANESASVSTSIPDTMSAGEHAEPSVEANRDAHAEDRLHGSRLPGLRSVGGPGESPSACRPGRLFGWPR